MGTQPIFPATVKNGVVSFVNSDGTNLKQVYAAGTNGSKVESLAAASSDTVAAVLQFTITVGGTDCIVGEASIPAGAGTDGLTKAVDVLSLSNLPWLRTDGNNRYLYLAKGSTLKAKAKTTVTAGKTVYLFAQAGDY